jgi:integrase
MGLPSAPTTKMGFVGSGPGVPGVQGATVGVGIGVGAAAALGDHLKQTMGAEWVFAGENGQPLRKENFARRSWRLTLKRAGLLIKFHGLRHSCATRLLTQGVHPKIVAERLGHSSVQVTLDTYSHAIPALGREAADKFHDVTSSE